jgi:DNA-binding NarL/FixJ family response regulator
VVSVRTVDTHVAAILGKLGAGTRREATEYFRNVSPELPRRRLP